MAKQRFINTKLWSDSWVRKLNPLDRYLFLYFLTNEHTNICGIYEVALETIAFETGMELDTLSRSMLRRLEPKIYYIDGWVCIANFEKHQRGRGNNKIAKGIKNAKSEVPSHIIDKLEDKKRYSMDSLSKSTDYSDLDLDRDIDINTNTGAKRKKKVFNPLGKDVIKAFEEVDPKNKTYYGNTTQRSACDFLLSEYGMEKILKAIKILPQINQKKLYVKQITSPWELKENWVKLGNAIKQQKSDTKNQVAFS